MANDGRFQPLQPLLRIGAQVACWYAASSVSSIMLQSALLQFRGNVTSGTVISLFAALVASLCCLAGEIVVAEWRKGKIPHFKNQSIPEILHIEEPSSVVILSVAVTHAGATTAMNLALFLTDINCVHTWRATEPVIAATAIAAKHVLEHGFSLVNCGVNLARGVAVLTIVFGVVIATAGDRNCMSFLPLLLGMVTNIGMLTRNSQLQVYRASVTNLSVPMYLGSAALAFSTLLVFAVAGVQAPLFALLQNHTALLLLLGSGVAAAVYNHVSISICRNVHLVSHSLLTLIKRPVILSVAAIWYAMPPSFSFLVGNALSLAGLLVYSFPTKRPWHVFTGVLFALLLLGALSNSTAISSLYSAPSTRVADARTYCRAKVFTIEFPEPGVAEPTCLLINMIETFLRHHPSTSLTIYTSQPAAYSRLRSEHAPYVDVQQVTCDFLDETPLSPLCGMLVELKWRTAMLIQRVDCPIPGCYRLEGPKNTSDEFGEDSVKQIDAHLVHALALALLHKCGGMYLQVQTVVQAPVYDLWESRVLFRSPNRSLGLLAAPPKSAAIWFVMKRLMKMYNGRSLQWTVEEVLDESARALCNQEICSFADLTASDVDVMNVQELIAAARSDASRSFSQARVVVLPWIRRNPSALRVATGSPLFRALNGKRHCLMPPSGRVVMAQTSYAHTGNNGDVIQAIAAMQYYPRIDIFVHRDRHHTTARLLYPNGDFPVTHWVANAWYMDHPGPHGFEWPPFPHVQPLLISMHFTKNAFTSTANFSSYYLSRGPVGARDLVTRDAFIDNGVPAYFSGCLTLTLNRRLLGFQNVKPSGLYHIVHVRISNESAARLLPAWVRDQAIYSTEYHSNVWAQDLELAHKRLAQFAAAKLVITSLLHVALPCVAMGVPVIFVIPQHMNSDPRFTGLRQIFLRIYSDVDSSWDYNFENPTAQINETLYTDLVKSIHRRFKEHPIYAPMVNFYGTLRHPSLDHFSKEAQVL